jgi:vacuolar-type H+-ATPase subunit H
MLSTPLLTASSTPPVSIPPSSTVPSAATAPPSSTVPSVATAPPTSAPSAPSEPAAQPDSIRPSSTVPSPATAPPSSAPSEPAAQPESLESRTTSPAPPTFNTQGLLSFTGATHAERNLAGDGLTQPSRSLKKLTDAQKATRKIRQETERHAQELLSKDLDQLLTKQREELEELAGQHGKKVEAIDKLISTSGHYKHKRSVNIENAKVHMKSQEVNAGKSSPPLLVFHINSVH